MNNEYGYCVGFMADGGLSWQGLIIGIQCADNGDTVFTINEMSWLDDSLTGRLFDVNPDIDLMCLFYSRAALDVFMRRTLEIEDKLVAAETVAILDQIEATTKH